MFDVAYVFPAVLPSILALALAARSSHLSAEMTNPSTGLPVSPRRGVEFRIERRSRVPMPE